MSQRRDEVDTRVYTEGSRFVRSAEYEGPINVQLDRTLRDTSSRYNIILQPGDSIHIPEYQPSVEVAGILASAVAIIVVLGSVSPLPSGHGSEEGAR